MMDRFGIEDAADSWEQAVPHTFRALRGGSSLYSPQTEQAPYQETGPADPGVSHEVGQVATAGAIASLDSKQAPA